MGTLAPIISVFLDDIVEQMFNTIALNSLWYYLFLPLRRHEKTKGGKNDMTLPSYMRQEQPRGEQRDIPQFNVGERVEAKIENWEETTGKYGLQIQFNVVLQPSGYPRKTWVRYYAVPQPNQYLGKLCLAIERVTGQSYGSVTDALNALKSYGRIFLIAKQPKIVTGDDGTTRSYPQFSVWPELLPGEQATVAPPAGLPSTLPTQIPSATGVSDSTLEWLIAHQDIIGKKILPEVYNDAYPKGVITELHNLGHIKMVQDYPWLSESARTLLMK